MLPILHIVVSLALIVLILLQERSGGLSGILGGEGSTFYHTRRGLEKAIFRGTIILALLFVALSIYQLVR
jgi:preprotein translocase subunit SecG